jgi:hypothetical protein
LLVRAPLPLAVLFILAGCGGSSQPKASEGHVVEGPGFSFSAPKDWTVRRTTHGLVASQGNSLVSVTRFTLLKPYDPKLFDKTARELDGVAARLAAQSGGKLDESATTVVDGRKIRAYRYASKGTPMRIGFVLVGRREYQLVCSGDTGDPCTMLFSSFSAT